MKPIILILMALAIVLSAVETYMRWLSGYHFSRAINNFFTWIVIVCIAILLYLK